MRQFLGIPYAAPPVGALRWKAPQKPTCWDGDLQTLSFKGACASGTNTNEDCLYLNVFTKPIGNVVRQPVMVFIHGGALTSGSGSYAANPISLVNRNVVVVTINYRLGALGFLAHPALDSANLSLHRTGNYGILDQIAALNWVKTNIARFGGDPNNVTIFGQSAGGLSVLVHLLSPLSQGLFHKAIIESGGFYNAATPLATAEGQGTTFAGNVGCSTGSPAKQAACLRALPVSTILANQGVLGSSVRLVKQDGLVITDTLKNLIMSGQFKRVPIINGSTHDETRFHIAGNQTLGTGPNCSFVSNLVPDGQAGSFPGAVTVHDALASNGFSGGFVPTAEAQYPTPRNENQANVIYSDIQTDVAYACRPFRITKWFSQYSNTVWAYEFNDPHAPAYLFPPFTLHDGTVFKYGAYHGSELPYLWPMSTHNACPPSGTIPPLTAPQRKLAAWMVIYWTTFARTGDPNPTAGASPPNWPKFAATSNLIKFSGNTPSLLAASDFASDHKCAFWDANSN
jgi:para-nitrobenzyl esterase